MKKKKKRRGKWWWTPYPLNRVRVRWILLLSFPAVVKSITTVGSRAFHKDKRRIPGTSDRPTTKRTRRSIGGANGGIRPSPLDPIPLPPSLVKIVLEGAPRLAKFRVAFSLYSHPVVARPSLLLLYTLRRYEQR